MKIRDILFAITDYNKLAPFLGEKPIKLVVTMDDHFRSEFTSYMELKEYLKENHYREFEANFLDADYDLSGLNPTEFETFYFKHPELGKCKTKVTVMLDRVKKF